MPGKPVESKRGVSARRNHVTHGNAQTRWLSDGGPDIGSGQRTQRTHSHRGPSCTARPQASLCWAPPSDLTRAQRVTTTHACPRHAHNTLMCRHAPPLCTHAHWHTPCVLSHTHTTLTRFQRHKLTQVHTQPHTGRHTHTHIPTLPLKCTVVQSHTRTRPHTDSYTLRVFTHVHPHSHTYMCPKYVHTHILIHQTPWISRP